MGSNCTSSSCPNIIKYLFIVPLPSQSFFLCYILILSYFPMLSFCFSLLQQVLKLLQDDAAFSSSSQDSICMRFNTVPDTWWLSKWLWCQSYSITPWHRFGKIWPKKKLNAQMQDFLHILPILPAANKPFLVSSEYKQLVRENENS